VEQANLSSTVATKARQSWFNRRLQIWQLLVCLAICAYLVLGATTHTLRLYHYFMLLAIPAAIFAAERGKRFFIDWSPLFAFWLGYDRLRLVQPHLLYRVSVEWPFELERQLFGWAFAGSVPPHALRAWLSAHSGDFFGQAISLTAQWIYLSHIIIFPALMLIWWTRSQWFQGDRETFSRYVKAFTLLHALAIGCYLLLPVAPPWWVSLHGSAQPSAELLAQVDMTAAMDGVIVQRMIQTAPMWFGAVPSLHGAYPVLFLLLAWRRQKRWLLTLIAIYGLMMWASTVILNQHYIIDLLAGVGVALAAFKLASGLEKGRLPADKSRQ
jgi:hypothetical protein